MTKKKKKKKVVKKRKRVKRRRTKHTKRKYRATFGVDRNDESDWRSAFKARHGRAPDASDWLMDYNYTWRDRYPRVVTTSRSKRYSNPRASRLIPKLVALANDPGATPAERANARARLAELV